MAADLELRDLAAYTGTENYYRGWLNVLLTDGVKYVMRNGYSWFVNDAISVIVGKGWRNADFLAVRLKLMGDNKAKMIIDDGNGNVLYTQKYELTDAKRELTLYYSHNVLMLSSEY